MLLVGRVRSIVVWGRRRVGLRVRMMGHVVVGHGRRVMVARVHGRWRVHVRIIGTSTHLVVHSGQHLRHRRQEVAHDAGCELAPRAVAPARRVRPVTRCLFSFRCGPMGGNFLRAAACGTRGRHTLLLTIWASSLR